MKALVQRVSEARVSVGDELCGSIGRGLLVFLGVEKGDGPQDLSYLVRKVSALRIFEDDGGRMNLAVGDFAGELLVVSQFTLAADCKKGTRPSFERAEEPRRADALYQEFVAGLRAAGLSVATGRFGAMMQVHLVNDGPVTLLIDSRR